METDSTASGLFVDCFVKLQRSVHRTAIAKGWRGINKEGSEFGTLIALAHSELSEALEATRVGNPPSVKTPGFSATEEELADVVIRLMGIAEIYHLDLAGAIIAKAEYNKTRAHKHGGKKF